MSGFEDVAKQFVKFYYDTFDADRGNLASLYREQSMLTFESAASQGVAAIIEKLKGLPLGKVQHRVDTLDAQPSGPSNGIIVMVTGALMLEQEQKPMNFTQTFQLMPEGGAYYIFNDLFKLVYPA